MSTFIFFWDFEPSEAPYSTNKKLLKAFFLYSGVDLMLTQNLFQPTVYKQQFKYTQYTKSRKRSTLKSLMKVKSVLKTEDDQNFATKKYLLKSLSIACNTL